MIRLIIDTDSGVDDVHVIRIKLNLVRFFR